MPFYLHFYSLLWWRFLYYADKVCFFSAYSNPFVKGNVAISHLIFADDVIIFSKGTPYAAYNLKRLLEDFHHFLGLGVNWNKSSIIFSYCDEETQTMVKGFHNVNKGSFPFRYLGIPMSSRRLSHHDCIPLLEKLKARLSSWKSSILSYAGRLELIKSILTALHIYWASTYQVVWS